MSDAVPAKGAMPFPGHRTQREVREAMERLDRDAERLDRLFAGILGREAEPA